MGDWWVEVLPTDEPGEIYVVADWTTWDPSVEFVIYHIMDYGASVDSFYYFCPDFELPHSVQVQLLPQEFHIQAFPNPFNSSVRLQWEGIYEQNSVVIVTDILGRRIWEWTGTSNEILWNAQTNEGINIASGKYFVTIQNSKTVKTVCRQNKWHRMLYWIKV